VKPPQRIPLPVVQLCSPALRRGESIRANNERGVPMDMAIELASWQFGFTIGLHIVLATFSIGLANYLMALEALWL
jgi:hypothetical protein